MHLIFVGQEYLRRPFNLEQFLIYSISYSPFNISGVMYKGMGGWKGGGDGGGGWETEGGFFLPLGHRQWCCVLVGDRDVDIHRIDRDGHWQQFGTPPTLISVTSGSTGPVIHQCSFIELTKSCL